MADNVGRAWVRFISAWLLLRLNIRKLPGRFWWVLLLSPTLVSYTVLLPVRKRVWVVPRWRLIWRGIRSWNYIHAIIRLLRFGFITFLPAFSGIPHLNDQIQLIDLISIISFWFSLNLSILAVNKCLLISIIIQRFHKVNIFILRLHVLQWVVHFHHNSLRKHLCPSDTSHP